MSAPTHPRKLTVNALFIEKGDARMNAKKPVESVGPRLASAWYIAIEACKGVEQGLAGHPLPWHLVM